MQQGITLGEFVAHLIIAVGGGRYRFAIDGDLRGYGF
jgi:hypothetical protein